MMRRKPAVNPARERMIDAHARFWLRLRDALVAKLPGNPDPMEVFKRLQSIIHKLRDMAELEPMNSKEHEFMLAVFLTYEFFPESVPALEKAMEPAFEVWDEAIISFDVSNRKIDNFLMREVWEKVKEIAARKLFQQAQEVARTRIAKRAKICEA